MEAKINQITNKPSGIKITLDVYVFTENSCFIAYAPALDLSGYGSTEEEAKESFTIVVDEYLDSCISRHTLVKDLRAHGWNVKSANQHKMSSPDFDALLNSNSVFRDILENRQYRKLTEPFEIIA